MPNHNDQLLELDGEVTKVTKDITPVDDEDNISGITAYPNDYDDDSGEDNVDGFGYT